ncbi:pyridoxal phosphate-dependent aminotransferase [Actinocorallia sp. B10E7]|uniref:pyridoxal phosphate-dependent aminotransferase n=1 Tax=Actinocorallia sp. B10E7 TaxID=3153558 RepID=UPI00325E3142
MTTVIPSYAIQDWLFARAAGRYDIDLGESGVQAQSVRDLEIDPDWDLDYSTDRGNTALREEIAALYSRDEADRVMVAHGAQEALYLFYRTFLRPGDHVITTSPGWQQSWEVPAHMGCRVSRLKLDADGGFDVRALAGLVREETRLLVLNSPCNPLGSVIAEPVWEELFALADDCGFWVLNDEEYLLDFSRSVVNRYERSVSVSSLSKVYGLPSLRTGWAFGPSEVVEAMTNYKRYTSVANSSLTERMATEALRNRSRHLKRYEQFVAAGLHRLEAFVGERPGTVRLLRPQGTPFGWLRVNVASSSQALAERLLEEQRVLVMPAEVFGSDNGLRLTYARPLDVLDEGLARLGAVVDAAA